MSTACQQDVNSYRLTRLPAALQRRDRRNVRYRTEGIKVGTLQFLGSNKACRVGGPPCRPRVMANATRRMFRPEGSHHDWVRSVCRGRPLHRGSRVAGGLRANLCCIRELHAGPSGSGGSHTVRIALPIAAPGGSPNGLGRSRSTCGLANCDARAATGLAVRRSCAPLVGASRWASGSR